jgi:hypothetical protein
VEKMMKNNDLLGMRYLKKEYFREEKDCINTRSLWFKTLNEELENWNDEKYALFIPKINRLKLEIFLKSLKLISRIYHSPPSMKNKNVMWVGEISNKDFLFKSQPYNLLISDARLSLNSIYPLLFNSNVSICPIYSSYIDLYSGIINEDEDTLKRGLKILENIFNHINPDIIVLDNDLFPLYRAVTLVAREIGIPTVEIQHGIYQHDYIPTGREADYVFVWGKRFKDIYLKNKIKDPDKIKILGYPYHIEKYDSSNEGKKLVTYLGQNLEVYDKELVSIKIGTIQNLKKICDNLNFDFIYRPHPGDNLSLLRPELENVNFTPPGEILQETIKKGDIFISFNSSTLIEANLSSKLSIQLKNYSLPTDDLEKLGACSKSVETFDELEEYLKKVKNRELSSFYRPVKESYIKIPSPNPRRRFLELIKDIL